MRRIICTLAVVAVLSAAALAAGPAKLPANWSKLHLTDAQKTAAAKIRAAAADKRSAIDEEERKALAAVLTQVQTAQLREIVEQKAGLIPVKK